MEINPDEWFRQAEYDIGTAEYLFNGEKCFYAVFMSHLSIEKALKGIFIKKLKEAPPKTHNLLYIIELIDLTLPENKKKQGFWEHYSLQRYMEYQLAHHPKSRSQSPYESQYCDLWC